MKKSGGAICGDIILKMVLTKVKCLHRGLQIVALNTLILNFFTETTNFLLTVKTAQHKNTIFLFYKKLDMKNCLLHSRNLATKDVNFQII